MGVEKGTNEECRPITRGGGEPFKGKRDQSTAFKMYIARGKTVTGGPAGVKEGVDGNTRETFPRECVITIHKTGKSKADRELEHDRRGPERKTLGRKKKNTNDLQRSLGGKQGGAHFEGDIYGEQTFDPTKGPGQGPFQKNRVIGKRSS